MKNLLDNYRNWFNSLNREKQVTILAVLAFVTTIIVLLAIIFVMVPVMEWVARFINFVFFGIESEIN